MQLSQIGKPVILEMDFIDPYTDEPTGIKVKLHSIKSKIGKEAIHNMQLKLIELKKDDAEKEITVDEMKSININLLCDLFVSINGLEDEDGKEIKSNLKAFQDALNQSDELLNGCINFLMTSGNFLKKQEKSL